MVLTKTACRGTEVVVAACCLFIFGAVSFAGPVPFTPRRIRSLSPVPGSKYVLPQATIILRFDAPVDPAITSSHSLFRVTGSASGPHAGELVLSGGSTLIFKPLSPFGRNETVSVAFDGSRFGKGDEPLPDVQYSFTTSRGQAAQLSVFGDEFAGIGPAKDLPELRTGMSGAPPDSPLAGFPALKITDFGDTSGGFLFLSNFTFPLVDTPFIMILRNNGTPIFARRVNGQCTDFKIQPNGRLSFFDGGSQTYRVMDRNFTVIDTFKAQDGYATDLHDLRLLGDNHGLLMAADPEIVDMSTVVAGGDTAAIVTGLIIQELDSSKNVVFQWRSWDHFLINDATHENMYAHTVDYVHGNALELDSDGNILLSCRHMDEITKIDRVTGDIIWRWGGKNNQFVFYNDSGGFSHQHALRRISNGHFTLFDNGNFHNPHYSRAVEYAVDEGAKSATLVWQYRNTPDYYGQALGYVQRLPNGNTLICWGATNPTVTEVQPDGTKIYELSFPNKVYSYRAYRLDWNPQLITGTKYPLPPPVPTETALARNYPNPFNPSTAVDFVLGSSSFVKLMVYDALGREVATLVNTRMAAGKHSVQWNATGMPGGVYYCRMTAGEHVGVRKMVLVK